MEIKTSPYGLEMATLNGKQVFLFNGEWCDGESGDTVKTATNEEVKVFNAMTSRNEATQKAFFKTQKKQPVR